MNKYIIVLGVIALMVMMTGQGGCTPPSDLPISDSDLQDAASQITPEQAQAAQDAIDQASRVAACVGKKPCGDSCVETNQCCSVTEDTCGNYCIPKGTCCLEDNKVCTVDNSCIPKTQCCSDERQCGDLCQTNKLCCVGEKQCASQTGALSSNFCTTKARCPQCATDANCGALKPKCKVTDLTSTCVKCLRDSDCSGTTPKCKVATNTCIGCLTTADCTGTTPICSASNCIKCSTDAQCRAKSAAAPKCSKAGASIGSCVA